MYLTRLFLKFSYITGKYLTVGGKRCIIFKIYVLCMHGIFKKKRRNFQMKKKSIIALILVVIFAVVLNYVAFFGYNIAGFTYGGMFDKEKGITQGIDLAGGSVITFEADAENPTDEQMDIVETIFQRRLVSLGKSDARITKGETGKITVEIPAEYDTDKAAELLGSVAKLTFVDADGNVVIDGAVDVKDAQYQYGQTSETGAAEPHVVVTFNKGAVEKFAAATSAAAGRASEGTNYISIMMDEEEVSRPFVDASYAGTGINSESCVITGQENAEEAQQLANQIKSGALPFNLVKISQETVGAELGADALPTSLLAAAIGILLIMIFMVVMYRIPGLMADIALAIYVGLIGLVLGLFRVNLNLSGIAGIVLSIGMAVDANCIIFERMKEELRLGKSIKAGVECGFSRAFSAIIDANVTTIITCVVLYLSGIGAVTGFAVTLGLGVVISMITAIFVTRFLMKSLVGTGVTNRALFCSQKKHGGEN